MVVQFGLLLHHSPVVQSVLVFPVVIKLLQKEQTFQAVARYLEMFIFHVVIYVRIA